MRKLATIEVYMFKFVSTTGRKSNTHCALCGKGRMRGNLVSHSKQRTKRLFKPNLQAFWVLDAGRRVRKMFCVKCLRKIKAESVPQANFASG